MSKPNSSTVTVIFYGKSIQVKKNYYDIFSTENELKFERKKTISKPTENKYDLKYL